MAEHGILWKIGREVRRLGRQLFELPRHLTSRYLSAPYYDRVHAKRVRVTEGRQPEATRVAIYLIFPKQGVLSSHIHTLNSLISKGFAPMVVSNIDLSNAALEALQPFAWKIVQRPNIGYDFGGYREGALALSDRLPSLTQLVFLNDSTWFPLPGSEDWLDQVQALGTDFAGAATNYGLPRADPSNYTHQSWTYRSAHPNFHYTSYALCIGARILQDPTFLTFWRRFPLSSDKKRTVRRGEIGLTQWVMGNGYSHAATFDLETLDKDLAQLSDQVLQEIAQNILVMEDARIAKVKSEVLSHPVDRHRLIPFILMATARQGMSYALQAYTIRHRGFAFLKKSPLSMNAEARDITLRIASDLTGDDGQMIYHEAQELGKRNAALASIGTDH